MDKFVSLGLFRFIVAINFLKFVIYFVFIHIWQLIDLFSFNSNGQQASAHQMEDDSSS
jgi:hypothetical protein